MLPTKEEQDYRIRILIDNDDIFSENMKDHAKWYAEQVIKHCAEVAKIHQVTNDEDLMRGYYNEVDKQSILNVINEL